MEKCLFNILIHVLLFTVIISSLYKIHIFKHFLTKYTFLRKNTISSIFMIIALIFLTLINLCLNASAKDITKKLLIICYFLLLMDPTTFLLYIFRLVFSSIIYTCQHIWVPQTKRAKEEWYASYKVKKKKKVKIRAFWHTAAQNTLTSELFIWN